VLEPLIPKGSHESRAGNLRPWEVKMSRKAMFGPDHPLWDKLIDMRRAGFFIDDLVAEAHRQGYGDLTYAGVNNGLKRSPMYFGAATRGALWLRNKYVTTSAMIDAFDTMRGLLGESLERLQRFYGSMAAAETEERRFLIEHEYVPVEINRAFRFAQALAELEIKLRTALGIQAMPNPPMIGQQNVLVLGGGDAQSFAVELEKAFIGLIGAASPELAALEQFGHDNVRPMKDEGEDPGGEGEYE
jgi:hypothetical protein